MSNQPEWEFVTNLGDVNPVEYGGYFIFRDKTGIYQPEGEYYDPETREAFRFSLDQLQVFSGDLIPLSIWYERYSLPHALNSYIEWFSKDVKSLASFVGIDSLELKRMFTSDDILERARAYESIGMYWGFNNLDNYPLKLTRKEAEKRYRRYTG